MLYKTLYRFLSIASVVLLLFSCNQNDTRESRFRANEAVLQQWQLENKQDENSAHLLDAIKKEFINLYRENSRDDIAFRSIMYTFFATGDPTLKTEQLKLLINNHTANPDIALLLTGPIGPTWLTPEYVEFFETFITDNSPARARISAMIALAQSYDAVLNARAEFSRKNQTLTQFLLEINQGESPTETAIRTFQFWMTTDPQPLRNRIQTLASRVIEENPQLELHYYSASQGLRYIAKAGQIAEGLLNGLTLVPGTTAPDTVLTTLDGELIKLSDFAGSVVMLDFWATWCIPCVQSIPDNRLLARELTGQPFQIITISVDDELKDVTDFLTHTNMPFINAYIGPDSDLLSIWNVSSYPTVFLIDQNGKIVMRHQGNTDELKREIYQLLISDE